MNKAMVISQTSEDDAAAAGFALPFLTTPSSSLATTPGLDVFWAHPTEDARYYHGRYLRGPVERACVAPEDFWPYASIHDGFSGSGPELGHGPVGGGGGGGPAASTQGRIIEQSSSALVDVNPSTPADHDAPGRRSLSANGIPDDCDETTTTCDATSDESCRASISSARCTPWASFSGPSMMDHSNSNSNGGNKTGAGGCGESSAEEAEEADMKQHREKNRVAARKCRQKAKDNAVELQRRESELRQQNKMLLGYVGSLREEILDLKDEILRHSDCNSGVIQNYIACAARRQME